MKLYQRIVIGAAESFAHAFLISLHLRWIAQWRRNLRKLRREARENPSL